MLSEILTSLLSDLHFWLGALALDAWCVLGLINFARFFLPRITTMPKWKEVACVIFCGPLVWILASHHMGPPFARFLVSYLGLFRRR